MWGYGLLPHQYEKMHKEDQEHVAALRLQRETEAARKPTKNASLQYFTPGDAKKGAGLFKVGPFTELNHSKKC